MRSLILSLCFALVAAPAFAALAPEYYQRARANADSVVVIEIQNVDGLAAGTGYGDCTVRGRVHAVERGSRYARGSTLSVGVPCMRARANIPAGPVQWQNLDALKASRWGRAFLTPQGGLALYQYDVLAAAPS